MQVAAPPINGRAPFVNSPAVCHARNLGAAAKAESAYEPLLEEADSVAEEAEAVQEAVAQEVEVAGETTLEVDAAAVADESLKIVNCNLSDSTVKVIVHVYCGSVAELPLFVASLVPQCADGDKTTWCCAVS